MKITVEELEEVVGFKISDQNKKLVNDFNELLRGVFKILVSCVNPVNTDKSILLNFVHPCINL